MSDGVKTRLVNRASALVEALFPDGCDAHVNETVSDADVGMERAAGLLALDKAAAVRLGRVFVFVSEGEHGVAVTAVETVDAAEKRAARRAAREEAVAESAAMSQNSAADEAAAEWPVGPADEEARQRVKALTQTKAAKPLIARRKGAPRK